MSLESELVARIQPLCPNAYQVVADDNAPHPHVVWQRMGGIPVQTYDGTLPGLRNALIQITTWAGTAKQACDFGGRHCPGAMRSVCCLGCIARGELAGTYDERSKLCGAVQTFSAWGQR